MRQTQKILLIYRLRIPHSAIESPYTLYRCFIKYINGTDVPLFPTFPKCLDVTDVSINHPKCLKKYTGFIFFPTQLEATDLSCLK